MAQSLSDELELERVIAIRDVTAGEGLGNGALLAGIAKSETGLAHCWSEATWACKGPASASCDGGPVIAGSGDGPCEDEQGGLGMFQFDAGTYADTLARDGEDILLLEGNIDNAVDFVAERVRQEVEVATDYASALSWMNSIPMLIGDPMMEEWASVIVCRYNGCCNDSATCRSRRADYRDNAIELYEKYGGREFWGEPSSGCELISPNERIIDETDDCYKRGGNPDYWRRVDEGQDGGSDWTMATSSTAAANYGVWLLEFENAGTYSVEVFLDGVTGKSRQAAYELTYADDQRATIVVDQTATSGWFSLGEFTFKADRRNRLTLRDNTGEESSTMTRLAFDAIRITAIVVDDPEQGEPGDDDDDDGRPGDNDGGGGGGCRTGGNHGPMGLWLLALVLLKTRRRRSRSRQ